MPPASRAWWTALPASLAVLTTTAYSRTARYYFNAVLYIALMGVCSILGVVYPLLFSVVGQRYNTNYAVARSFYALTGTLIGIKITIVEGEEYLKQRPAIILGNHQSFLDILYLGRMFPSGSVIMAKKELRWMPLLGQFSMFALTHTVMLGGNVFIDRKSRASAIQTTKAAGEQMRKHKLALFAFPEGTRSHSVLPELLPFKKGVFHLAIQTQLPIVPVVCENYSRLYDSKTRFEGGDLRLAVLPPISTEGMTNEDTDKLISTVHDAMLRQLVKFDQENDAEDVQRTLHPSQPSPQRVRGLAGLFARLVGDGSKSYHNRTVRRVQKEEEQLRANAHNGTSPSDYGLVSASHSQAPAS